MFLDLPLERETKTSLAARLFDYIDKRMTDLAPSTMEVSPRVYFDEELALRERQEIFANVPILAAHGSELPTPGSFVTAQLPNNAVVVVRQSNGGVRAFVNSCRHRGARLVTDDAGNKRIFSCGYHGWSYDTDGSLRSIAQEHTFGEIDHTCMGLIELPAEERHGIVWVVDSPKATIDVAEWLGPEMDASLGSFGLDAYHCYKMGNFDEPINWKVLMDAFLDAYHLTATHGGSVAPYFYNNIQIWEPFGRHGRTISPRKSIDKIRDLPPEDAPIDNHITIAHFFMPNMSILRQPDHFELLNFLPHPKEVARCRMQMRILIKDPTVDEELARRWEKNWDILMAVLRDEDLVLNRYLQQAVQNTDAPPLVIGRNEIVNQHFHDWLERAHKDPRHWG